MLDHALSLVQPSLTDDVCEEAVCPCGVTRQVLVDLGTLLHGLTPVNKPIQCLKAALIQKINKLSDDCQNVHGFFDT